jgi:ubiquinone biosynthesis protein UbiJ
MNSTFPFSFLESVASRFQPPAWMVDEGQQRLVLFLNHVLMQEKQAQERLLRHKGRVVHARWGVFALDLIVTPAGLVDRALPSARADLVLMVETESPLTVAQSVLSGKAPPVRIEGEVQLAAELGWLAENLRWDVEEDLSRLIGDAPAHGLANAGRRLLAGLKLFLARTPLASAVTPAPGFSSPVFNSAPVRSEPPQQPKPMPAAASSASVAGVASAASATGATGEAASAPSAQGSAAPSPADAVPPTTPRVAA